MPDLFIGIWMRGVRIEGLFLAFLDLTFNCAVSPPRHDLSGHEIDNTQNPPCPGIPESGETATRCLESKIARRKRVLAASAVIPVFGDMLVWRQRVACRGAMEVASELATPSGRSRLAR